MSKLYYLDIDEVMGNLSLFTIHDVGGEGHGIVVEEDQLDNAIEEIVKNFEELVSNSFCPYEEEEEN